VSYAFHSSLMEPVAPAFREVLAKVGFARARRPNLISTVTGRALTDRDDVRALLERQLCSPVRFTDALEAAGPVDLFVELGPGHTLAALAASSTSVPAVSVDAAGPSLRPFLLAVGAAFALGAPVRACRLADGRFARPFDLDRPREFLVNPCELAPASCAPAPVAPRAIAPPPQPDPLPVAALPGDATAGDTCALLRSLVSRSADLPLDAIDAQARFLSDLHLNSITVAELLAEASRRLGSPPLAAPTDFADASLTEAARALDQVRAAEPPATSDAYPGV
jgi:enediyne polyketide synthase